MERQVLKSPIIFTNKARCRDCYRCVRACPVKAIRMVQGQAYVVEERCVLCGACIRECPQGAKAYRHDAGGAALLLESGEPVAASIAPSFAAAYREWEWRRLPSALRRLGFAYVAETTVAATEIARQTMEHSRENPAVSHIASCCPSVVRYVERYVPDRVGGMVQLFSPMLAHARHIKHAGRARHVVFIGPCVAKKAEAERPGNAGIVDCVITFSELNEWLERGNISLAQLEESSFDETPAPAARYFPLGGGQLHAADVAPDVLSVSVLSVSGFSDVSEALALPGADAPRLIEPLFCGQGCVNGPGMAGPDNVFERRMRVLRYAHQCAEKPPAAANAATNEIPYPAVCTTFVAKPVPDDSRVTDAAIRGIYAKTGKLDPKNQLNCGACGYSTCRDKAVAVVRGMAEAEMCIPYMRYLAERRTDRIIETSPNGIVTLDENLRILSMNPAFRRLFMCSEAVLGRHISYLMDPDPFERLAAGVVARVECVSEHRNYRYVFHQIMYRLPEENQFVGIFVDVTETRANRDELGRLRAETLAQARELMEHQLKVAQQVTRFLGENTARGEELVEKLVRLVGDPNDGAKERQRSVPWATST
jgi:PAS domain S-box-containing protein